MITEKLMCTLNPQFDHIVVAIEKPSDFSSLKSEDLQVSLEAHELRLVEKKLSSRFHSGIATSNIQERWCK
jgi:hypothetical protein